MKDIVIKFKYKNNDQEGFNVSLCDFAAECKANDLIDPFEIIDIFQSNYDMCLQDLKRFESIKICASTSKYKGDNTINTLMDGQLAKLNQRCFASALIQAAEKFNQFKNVRDINSYTKDLIYILETTNLGIDNLPLEAERLFNLVNSCRPDKWRYVFDDFNYDREYRLNIYAVFILVLNQVFAVGMLSSAFKEFMEVQDRNCAN